MSATATPHDRAAAERAYALQQARTAWLTASRDDELDRWRDLYELAVPRPRPAAAERSAA
jgi:hypothetical protein